MPETFSFPLSSLGDSCDQEKKSTVAIFLFLFLSYVSTLRKRAFEPLIDRIRHTSVHNRFEIPRRWRGDDH